METVLDRMKRIDSQGAVPGTSVAEPKQPDDREQAILDRHTSATPQVSALQRAARIDAQREIDVRKQQRAYAEKAKSTDATTVDLTKEMLTNLNNRSMVLETYRQMSPSQRQDVLKLAPGIAQQLGDDRGGLAVRAINAVTGGIADVSQPIKELAGQVAGTDWGGAPEEIEFIRQLEGASQEFAPARPDDPWYVRGPLQALQMTPWMTTVVGGNVAGSAIAKTGGQVLARGASAGVPLAKPAFQAIGAVGKAPKLLGLKGATTKGTMEAAGGLAGITAAAFPGQYAQEVDSLKALGMEDNLTMRVLAGGTAAIAGLIEGIVPNPFKAGNVPLKEGAIKAARQYLWNAAKQAPGEMSEEYLQGVTSGLGEHVAQYLDENAQEKSIADAFKTGWEQAKEAALPMAFLLGIPAVGGAANAARLARLQAIRNKGFVSTEDAQKEGIEGKNRKERLANADAAIKQLEQEAAAAPTPTDGSQAKPWWDFGTGEPEGEIPPPPGLGLLDKLRGKSAQGAPPTTPPPALPQVPPPLPKQKGPTDASQVPANETRDDVQGDGREGSQEPVGSQVRQPGQDQGGAKQASQEPAAPEVQVEQPKQVQGEIDDNQLRIFKDGKWRNATVTAVNEGDAGWRVKHVKVADPETGLYEYVPFPGDAAKGYSSYEQARDDVLAVLKEKYKEPPAISATPAPQPGTAESTTAPSTQVEQVAAPPKVPASPAANWNGVQRGGKIWLSGTDAVGAKLDDIDGGEATLLDILPTGELQVKQSKGRAFLVSAEQASAAAPKAAQPASGEQTGNKKGTSGEQAQWDVVKAPDGKLYRMDPNAKTQSERLKTRQAVDPSEGVVLITKDQFGKPIPPETLKARQEFADKAKPGALLNIKGFETSGPYRVMNDGKLLDTKTGRVMADVQERANLITPGMITWVEESPSAAGSSEEVGTKPTTGSPTVSPDAPATPETSKGKAEGANRSSEARADNTKVKKGWQPSPPSDVSIIESPDLKLETSRREKKDPQFPIDAGSPVTVYRRGSNGKEEMQSGVVEDFADHMPGNIKVRLSDGTLATPLLVDVGPARDLTTPPKPKPATTPEAIADNTDDLRKMLADVNAEITKQGRVVDDRLLSRKRELERLLKEPAEKPVIAAPSQTSPVVQHDPYFQGGGSASQKTEGAGPSATAEQPAEDDFTAAVNAAFDERFGGKATAETEPTKPNKISGRKDQQPREKKTLTEKAAARKERTSAAKAEKLAKFKDLLKQKKIIKAVYDPKAEAKVDAELLAATVELTAAAIDDGVSTFLEYVTWIADNIGESATRKIAPYLEAGWTRLSTYDRFRGKIDKAGKVADVLGEVQDYGTLESPNRVELGKHFQKQLESGKDYKSIVEARKEAATLIAGGGANIEPGTPAAKAIDEAVEQGVVRAARSIAESGSDPLAVYDSLLDLYDRQPRLAVRTGTSMRQQAYSTPAPAAWIANILSDTSRDDTAYDSSAGNGMLLLGVEPENAIANELNPERAQSLRELGYQVHEGDATKYTPERQPERIIINPPFGVLEGQTWTIGGTTTDKIDHAIALKTLESLPEDGKAVLIIGSKGFEQRQPKDELRRGEAYKNDKNFYNALYDGYNVTDHFTLHGDMYSKQGAAFPIDVIVIDGRGKSALPKPYQIDRQNAIPRVINSWKELRDVGERYLDTGTGRSSDLSTEPVEDDMGGLSSLLEGQGKGTGSGGRRSGKNTGRGGSVPPRGDAGDQQTGGDSGQSTLSGSPDGQRQPDAKSISDEGKPDGTGRRSRDAKGLDRPSADVEGDAETEFQVTYKKRSGVDGVGTLVPRTQARAVEQALEVAEDRYGNLDEFVSSELGYDKNELQEYFSAEQVDALALAIARHKEGKAFVLGDQTGVGKGRVAAGMMVYAKRQGLVPIFMTQSPDLYADMYRDLQDIGQHSENEPFYALATNTLTGDKGKIRLPGGLELSQTAEFSKNTINALADSVTAGNGTVVMITVEKTTDAKGRPLGETPSGKPRVRKVQEQRDYDAVFTTYSQLQTVSGSLKERHTALSRIAPKAFFVLDESHNAGGSVSSSPDAQGTGTTAAELIRAMVNESSGVLFLSATYAKRADVMDLYAKTGMADSIEGTEEGLVETLQQGGIPLQQVLSEMLVESGAYMRRERSFEGIEFEAKIEDTGTEEAGTIAEIFGAIDRLDRIKNEIVKTKSFKRWLTSQGLGLGTDSATGRRGMESSTFSSIVHNLVNQMLLSIKADATADAAIASIERGEAPVIALSNTMGSALNQYLETNPANVGDEIDFRFSRAGERYLERSREIMLTDVDSAGRRTARRVRLPDEVLGEDGVAAYNEAKELIDGFAADIPASPIDHIRNRIQEAGYTVREVTGRDLTVDYSEGKMRLSQRPKDETGSAGKLATVKAFNSGELDAMILNQSGSTGLSAHASKLNPPAGQKRRHMIVAQADANIDTFMQMLGRINRTGQVTELEGQPRNSNLPHYTLLMTNVPAETRPAAVLIKKLSSLNANVTADSKGSVSFDAPDILNKVGDRVVAEYIADNPALNHALGDIVEVNHEGSPRVVPDIARKVSGRMAMRPIPEQQAFWDSVTETYAEEIEQLNKLGKNPLAATKMDLGARTLERVEIFAGDTTADSPFLQPAYADRVRVKKQGEPMTPEEIKSAIKSFYGIRTKRKRGPDPFGDMESELHRETITGEDVEQNVTERTDDLGEAARKWAATQIEIATEAIEAKAAQQVARLVNDEAIARMRSRADRIESAIRRRLNSVAPGMAVEVSEVQEEGRYSDAIDGIVIDVRVKKGKEHLPSGWVATIALSSPDRVLRVPFSRIETAGNSQPGDVYVAPSFSVADDQLYSGWEETGDVYEERIIGTGNVLAAFDRLVSPESRGNIIFFTNEEGVSQRGVLMPRSFNLDRWAADRPVTFTTPQQVLDFIGIDPGHQVNDPNFAIQFTLDGATMNVRSPRSRQRSGRYTTNQELIDASGTDFVSVGQILQMKVTGKKRQLAVIEAAQKLGPLIAANYEEDARNIAGSSTKRIEIENGEGGGTDSGNRTAGDGESRSLDSFTSPELQDRQSMGAAKRRIESAADLVGDDDGGSGSKYASPDSEFERRWQMATRGISKKTLATKLREFWQELVKSTVRGSLPELPRSEQFGEARSALHAYQNAPVYAQLAAADLLKKTSKPLSASDYDLFTRVVIMRDQAEAADKGERLSYGLTPDKAKTELSRVEALAASNERVQASLEYRKQWTEAMVNDFLSAHEYLGLDMTDRFKRENYFRHQVLYYMEAQQRGLGKKKVELTPNRGWLKGRTSGDDLGEAFDINANYLQAEWEVSTQMIADTKRAQAIGRLKRHYDKMQQLKEEAKYNNYVAVVGGKENMDEIEELRGMIAELRETGSLDSGEKAQLKEWSERLWELDPTMPFRQQMAIARDQIERGADSLGEEVSGDFLRYVAALAKQDDSPLQGPALSFLKALSDRKAFIKNALGDQYQTWEDVVPDDHEEVAIRPGRAMFQAYSVPEQVASELMADLSKTLGISAEDLRPLTALGSKYTPLVVPQEVAAQMAAIDNLMDFGWLDRMVTRPMRAWKRWVLMSPTRVFKYNLRNLSEVDKVMALNPAALKDIPQAIRDLWKLYSGADDIPATVRDWVERGGSGTLVRVNELGELNELKQFAKLIADKRSGVVGKVIKAPANAWKAYWSAAGISSDFRESILRYAAYLNYLKQLDAGKLTNYGGSVRAEVDGIKDNKDKAMRLSADLLGDYGDISLVGQFLRSRFAPFWSFQETNLRTYFRGLVNLASNEQSAIKAGMQIARAAGIGGLAKTPFLAYKLGRIAILFYGLKAMTTAFNQLLFGDDDDELSEEEKRKAHLTFGKNSKGEVQYFSRIGTAADVLDWVGLDSVDYDLRDVLDGRRTFKEVLNDMARSPVDKAYGMLSPFIKVPTELAVGQTAYPSVGKPRPIRDRGRYIAQNLGLQKEYDKLTGKPSAPYSVTDLFLYKVEPGTSAYYLTLDAKFRWLKTARNRGVGYSDSSRGNALRNYKMAVRLKDQTAADKYLAEYEADEGTKEGLLDSLEWSHPAGGLSTIDAYLFYKSLAPVEQAEYRDAERFYYSELLTEEQAKAIRTRRDKRLSDLAVGKNKDGSPKGKPVKQSDETQATYQERLREWAKNREIALEALKTLESE